jgi:hypothetical protein
MEMFLNVVWLVAGLLVFALAVQHARKGLTLRECLQLGIAVFCLWVLLFPVISASDDLQQVPFPSGNMTVVLSEGHAQHSVNLLFISLLLLLSLQAAFATSYFARKVFVPASSCDGFLRAVVSRPPPFSFPGFPDAAPGSHYF